MSFIGPLQALVAHSGTPVSHTQRREWACRVQARRRREWDFKEDSVVEEVVEEASASSHGLFNDSFKVGAQKKRRAREKKKGPGVHTHCTQRASCHILKPSSFWNALNFAPCIVQCLSLATAAATEPYTQIAHVQASWVSSAQDFRQELPTARSYTASTGLQAVTLSLAMRS